MTVPRTNRTKRASSGTAFFLGAVVSSAIATAPTVQAADLAQSTPVQPTPTTTPSPSPTPTPASKTNFTLPSTSPGLSPDEGLFLHVQADDGLPTYYFVANALRHNLTDADVQEQIRANPLRFVRDAGREEVLVYPEAAPLGRGKLGRLTGASDQPDAAPIAESAADPSSSPTPAPTMAPSSDTPPPAASVTAAPAATATPIAAPTHGATVYVVERGESLSVIADRFDLFVSDLLAANNLENPDLVRAGQEILVPESTLSAGPAPAPIVAAPVAAGEHAVMPAPAPAAAPEAVPLDALPAGTHVVALGETLSEIADGYDVRLADLVALNGLEDANWILEGLELQLPAPRSYGADQTENAPEERRQPNQNAAALARRDH